MPTAFLSSTASDLKEHRAAVCDAINRLDGWKCIAMEDFGARNTDATRFCEQKVGECDLFVGLVGHLHGSCPNGPQDGPSFTELEFDAAERFGKPRLMFMASDDFPMPGNLREIDAKFERQKAFRTRVREDQICAWFGEPETLANDVVVSIRNWESEHRRVEKPGGPPQQPLIPHLDHQIWLLNRRPQWQIVRDRICAAIDRSDAVRPLVFVLSGHSDDSHEDFVSRCGKIEIPELLGNAGLATECFCRPALEWPVDGAGTESVLNTLVDTLIASGSTQTHKVERIIEESRTSLCVSHHIDAGTWDSDPSGLLKSWIAYLRRDCPNPPPGRLMVFFICLVMPEVGARRLMKNLLTRRPAREMNDLLNELREQYADDPYVTILPDLKPIRRAHVRDWVFEVETRSDNQVNLPAILHDFIKLFEDDTQERPYMNLREDLHRRLQDFQAQSTASVQFSRGGP